jgi:hypothetical protein
VIKPSSILVAAFFSTDCCMLSIIKAACSYYNIKFKVASTPTLWNVVGAERTSIPYRVHFAGCDYIWGLLCSKAWDQIQITPLEVYKSKKMRNIRIGLPRNKHCIAFLGYKMYINRVRIRCSSAKIIFPHPAGPGLGIWSTVYRTVSPC